MEPTRANTSEQGAGLVPTLAGALCALDEKYRLPLALCYEEGLSQRQAAAVLEMPERTLSRYVSTGLAKLRKALERAGYPAAVAAVLGGLKQTAPSVPASLAGRVEALVSSGAKAAPRKLASRAARREAAAKGGFSMKLIAGVVLAASVATGVAVMGGGGPEPLPAEKPKKFSIPVWHPDARWEMVKDRSYAATPGGGELDGPRQELMWRKMWRCGVGENRSAGMTEGGRPEFISYDPPTERYHTVTGSAGGYLDGPFARARFGCRGYNARARQADSFDGRYHFATDPENGHLIRCLDFEKQEVRTLLPDQRRSKGIVADSKGRLLVVLWQRGTSQLVYVTPDGKSENGPALEMGQDGWTPVLALDEKNGRLYGTAYLKAPYKWYVWYWNLTDGSFHGVLPSPPKGGPRRKQNELGPFEGAYLYGEGGVDFGPDDPDKRFLYMGRCDTAYLFRLDLEKKLLEGFDAIEGRFKSTGFPRSTVYPTTYYYPPLGWMKDGSFVGGRSHLCYLYRRIK